VRRSLDARRMRAKSVPAVFGIIAMITGLQGIFTPD
jgi:hypothetical protein